VVNDSTLAQFTLQRELLTSIHSRTPCSFDSPSSSSFSTAPACSSSTNASLPPASSSSSLSSASSFFSIAAHSRGSLRCPGCHCDIGWFNWEGSRCSCLYFEKPAFQIAKSRVTLSLSDEGKEPDEVRMKILPDLETTTTTTTTTTTKTTAITTPIALQFGVRQSVLKFKSRNKPN